MDATKLLQKARIVPVVVIEDAKMAVQLAETLLESGLNIIEVTLRTKAALEAIEKIALEVPDTILGAGSVRNAEQLGILAAQDKPFFLNYWPLAPLLFTRTDVEEFTTLNGGPIPESIVEVDRWIGDIVAEILTGILH